VRHAECAASRGVPAMCRCCVRLQVLRIRKEYGEKCNGGGRTGGRRIENVYRRGKSVAAERGELAGTTKPPTSPCEEQAVVLTVR